LSRSLSFIRAATVLCAVVMVIGGCAGAGNNTPSSQGEQPYSTAYGISSEGTTTDLYTELFGPRKPATPPETATAAVQPVQQPAVASPAMQPGQTAAPALAATQPAQIPNGAKSRQGKSASTSTAGRQVQPAPAPPPAPVVVAQQPPAPQAPPEPDVPTAYGITANGPTTDLFTELFGPRRRDGQ
jgi:hypothetical protein